MAVLKKLILPQSICICERLLVRPDGFHVAPTSELVVLKEQLVLPQSIRICKRPLVRPYGFHVVPTSELTVLKEQLVLPESGCKRRSLKNGKD